MFATTFVYSFFPLAASFGIEDSTPVTFVLLSSLFGMALSAVFSWVTVRGRGGMGGMVRDAIRLPEKSIFMAALSGTLANLGNILFIVALGVMSKAGATIIMESWPIMAMFLAPLLIDKKWEKLRLYHVALGAVALAGIGLISVSEHRIALDDVLHNPGPANNNLANYMGVMMAFMGSFCFALSGVFRTQFVNDLPADFKTRYGGRAHQIPEVIVCETISKVFYLPIIFIAWLAMEPTGSPVTPASLFSAFLVALIIVLVNIFYSYALYKAENPSVNIIWYFAPLLAVIWLAIFGLTQITMLVAMGAGLIVGANICVALLDMYYRKMKAT